MPKRPGTLKTLRRRLLALRFQKWDTVSLAALVLLAIITVTYFPDPSYRPPLPGYPLGAERVGVRGDRGYGIPSCTLTPALSHPGHMR